MDKLSLEERKYVNQNFLNRSADSIHIVFFIIL